MIGENPRVSVLIPAFNSAETFDACLRSVQLQSLADWECVIVDDGSTDATRSVATRFAASDARFRNETPGRAGLVAALNHGLETCRGELVSVLRTLSKAVVPEPGLEPG